MLNNPLGSGAGSGIASASNRVHVVKGSDWNRSAGTDFWLLGGPAHAGATGDDLITNFGWTETSLLSTQGLLADLMLSTDTGTPNIIGTDAAADSLLSPIIFGDYAHGLIASKFLGYYPTKLCLEAYAAFSAASANETVSGFGFSSGQGTTATNHIAYIHSNGTNIALRGTPGTGAFTDTGGTVAAVGATYHLWKVVLEQDGSVLAAVEWFMDGTSQGTITLVEDFYPTGFAMGTTTTNRPQLAWCHIWYE